MRLLYRNLTDELFLHCTNANGKIAGIRPKWRPLVKYRSIFFFGLLVLLLSACNAASNTPTATLPPADTATPAPTETPLPSITPTPLAPLIVFVRPSDADPALADPIENALHNEADARGMRWQVRPSLATDELMPELALLVALPGVENLAGLVAAAPDTQFLAVGISGLQSAPNLTTVQLNNDRPDQLGFMAGFIASMLTPDYRSGMVGLVDDPFAQAARQAFMNGDRYYCGLCLQAAPPFYDYPLYVEASPDAASVDWWGNAEYLHDHQAETVFVYPGAGDEAMLRQMVEAGIHLIGVEPPPDDLRSNWIVSLRSDPLPTVLGLIPQILDGQAGQVVVVPLQFTDINVDLFSPGRQMYANEILADLLAGYIDTGAELGGDSTGNGE